MYKALKEANVIAKVEAAEQQWSHWKQSQEEQFDSVKFNVKIDDKSGFAADDSEFKFIPKYAGIDDYYTRCDLHSCKTSGSFKINKKEAHSRYDYSIEVATLSGEVLAKRHSFKVPQDERNVVIKVTTYGKKLQRFKPNISASNKDMKMTLISVERNANYNTLIASAKVENNSSSFIRLNSLALYLGDKVTWNEGELLSMPPFSSKELTIRLALNNEIKPVFERYYKRSMKLNVGFAVEYIGAGGRASLSNSHNLKSVSKL